MEKKDFNEYRFEGLHFRKCSNKYLTMNRVSENEQKIVVKIGEDHLIRTKFGYALVLDRTHVVFVKDWQVSKNYYGNEILLDKNYFDVKVWGNHELFFDSETGEEFCFEHWLETARIQQNANNEVKWEYDIKSFMKKALYGV